MEEVKKKRGRPRKTAVLPEEIQTIVDQVQELQKEDFKQMVKSIKSDSKVHWDIAKDEEIEYFDKTKSYEITGYRPITKTQGLDFKPEWFTKARDTYLRTGHYSQFPRNTKAYGEFWDEEYRRCRDGFTVNGYTLTGNHYYFLNYYQLPNTDVQKSGTSRSNIFPNFFVYQYEFFHYFELCKCLKKDICLMKARGIGFSEINASICLNMYNCFPESICMISAQNKNYLDKSLEKTWNGMNFANDNTDGGFFKLRQVKDTQYVKKSSWYKIVDGQKIETGWKSLIEGVLADTDAKIRGDRVDLLIYEEAGSNPVLRKSFIKGEALCNIGGNKFGLRMCGGTGRYK